MYVDNASGKHLMNTINEQKTIKFNIITLGKNGNIGYIAPAIFADGRIYFAAIVNSETNYFDKSILGFSQPFLFTIKSSEPQITKELFTE